MTYVRALVLAAVVLACCTGRTAVAATGACASPRAGAAYSARVERVLGAARDVWGDALVARPGGPTYASAANRLAPLLYALGPGGRPLTASGVYYLAFAYPTSEYGPRGFALHVADGSQIVTRRAGGRSLTVFAGGERYGSCLARLVPPQLRDGYLPVLETGYTDAHGAHYTQESFVSRLPGVHSLVSFVHVHSDRGTVRLNKRVFPGIRDVYAGWINDRSVVVRLDASVYAAALTRTLSFWTAQLARGTTFVVPEARVMNAERALLIQELAMTWRYSVGNTYEELSFAEAQDVAQLFAEYGFMDNAKAILRFSLRRLQLRFTDWRAGERLLAGAAYFRLSDDRQYVAEETPELARVVAVLGQKLERRPGGLLVREPYSSDIGTPVYGLHGQTVVWQGLLEMGRVWAATGHPLLARRCRTIALRLERGLRRAVAESMRLLTDGSLFVPAALLAGSAPFERLTDSRNGSYWNLVMPYALASGFFAPRGALASGIWRYQQLHGARLLGLVRANASKLYGVASPLLSGTDQVYGFNLSRFLADEDDPDQLVLTLYGTLAAGMTPNTFVSGEAATVAPLRGALYRSMFLPPNADSNAALLETLRLMLVHESRGPKGAPRGLELAYATPRGWLKPGKTIAVTAAPTSFGQLTYSLARASSRINVVVQAPRDPRLHFVRLRLRLPAGERVVGLEGLGRQRLLDGSTVDLTGLGAVRFSAVLG